MFNIIPAQVTHSFSPGTPGGELAPQSTTPCGESLCQSATQIVREQVGMPYSRLVRPATDVP